MITTPTDIIRVAIAYLAPDVLWGGADGHVSMVSILHACYELGIMPQLRQSIPEGCSLMQHLLGTLINLQGETITTDIGPVTVRHRPGGGAHITRQTTNPQQ